MPTNSATLDAQQARSAANHEELRNVPTLQPAECDQLELLGKALEEIWIVEVKGSGRDKASLSRALIKCFGWHFFTAALWEIIGKCLFGVMVAVTLGLLITDIKQYTSDKYTDTGWTWDSLKAHMIYKTLILIVLMSGNIVASQYFLFYSTYVGMKCRLACTYLIYRKALRISLMTLETTTSGQIMNLVTNDVNKFDTAFYYLQYIYIAPIQTVVIFILLAIFYIGFMATFLGMLLVCIYLSIQVYLGRSFGRYRIESTQRTNERVKYMGELIDALGVIKMYAWEDYFERSIKEMRNVELSKFKQTITRRAIYLSFFYGACKLVLMVILVAYALMGDTFDAYKVFTAITMTNAMRTYLTLFFPYSVAQASEMRISLERIRQFLVREDEQDMIESADGPKPIKPPAGWPQSGAIKFDNLTLSYQGSPGDVLHNISFDIKAGERIGIVGRTGAGKSSIVSALFRMTNFKGRILIDGIDTKLITLKDLRSSISIIPQEPILFTGTIRQNLDPFNLYTDEMIWNALSAAQLQKVVTDLEGGLEASVIEGGHNFSAGQRQLVCLARAILRKNKILILDEAEAALDPRTSAILQVTLRNMFDDRTVITIAHRLHTIIDLDRVLVLESSEVREYDEPHILLQNKEGLFSKLVDSTNTTNAAYLRKLAEESYKIRHQR